jgi:transcriptional regulator with XRE-family HTH domain
MKLTGRFKLTGKTYTDVVEMARDILPKEKDWCDKLERNIADRELSRTFFVMRNHAGLSQAEMARRMGCTQSRVSKLESAPASAISSADMQAYANALGLVLNITFHPKIGSAQAVKIHAGEISRHLDHLAKLAHTDPGIEQGVTKFFKETITNLVDILSHCAQKLPRRSLPAAAPADHPPAVAARHPEAVLAAAGPGDHVMNKP